jgi:hypothetical protein
MLLKIPALIVALALVMESGFVSQASCRLHSASYRQQQEPPQSEMIKKGLGLVEEIIIEARALRLPENRVFVQAAAADLVWAHDEKSSRAIFDEALAGINDLTNGVAPDDSQFTELTQLASELRRDVLLKIARHDSSWARQLMLATARSSPQVSDELQLDLSLVTQTNAPVRLAAQDQSEAESSPPEKRMPERAVSVPAGASPEMRDGFFSEAAVEAQSAGDFERARQMASHITNQFQRSETLMAINEKYLLEAARAGKVEQTLGALTLLRTPEERASILIELAIAMTQRNEKEQARDLIKQARDLLVSQPQNFGQLNARLRVVSALAQLDPDESFEVIGMIINQLDGLAAATTVVDGFITEERLTRDDELVLKQIQQLWESVADESAQDNGLTSLARREFDRLKNAVDRFQHTELRILAQLSLAESVLT